MAERINRRAARYLRSCVALILFVSLMLANGVSASSIKDTRIVINIPSRTLWLYAGDQLVRYYPVGVGRPGFLTPLGRHQVIRKVSYPGWENPYKPAGRVRIRPGGRNPLGTRWMGFKEHKGGEYGIHGTDNPRSVGKFSSHGCVRMLVKDAEDLFDRVDVGTPVEVIYDLTLIRREGEEIRVIVYPDIFRRGAPTAAQVKERILTDYPTVVVDEKKLIQALKRPAQKPVAVGTVPVDEPEDRDKPKDKDIDKPEDTTEEEMAQTQPE